ncbi:MAG: thymidylate synthase [Nanobdellota archaeon]
MIPIVEITAKTTKTAWIKTIQYIKEHGREYTDHDKRVCKEVTNIVITINNNKQQDIEYPINTMTSSNEWLYPSKEELESIMFKKQPAPTYEYTYGGRLFNFSNVLNQIKEVIIPALQKNPHSRQAIACVYNPLQDSARVNSNIPALMYIQCRKQEKGLFLTAMFRSNDMLFGFPANIYQLFKLQEYISREINSENDSISIVCNSAHLFLDNQAFINEILEKK